MRFLRFGTESCHLNACPSGVLPFLPESYPSVEIESRPHSGGGGIRIAYCLGPWPYAFVHFPMFHTGPSLVGFSFRPLSVVR